MSIQYFCPRWGSEDLRWSDFCRKVKEAGYDGIEYAIAHTTTDAELEDAWSQAEKQGLLMLPQHFDTYTADFGEHLDAFHRWLERIQPYPAIKVNSQTGKDFFSFDQNRKLIELGNRYGVVHETHRGKFSFAAHITAEYLQQIPDLRLTLDVSHWVCVAESLLYDQQPSLELAINRTDHIHARVGYPEGPQVSDPRAPEWAEILQRHMEVWDDVIEKKANQRLTITTEFGPFPYMVHIPGIRDQPIACQWDINCFILNCFRNHAAYQNSIGNSLCS